MRGSSILVCIVLGCSSVGLGQIGQTREPSRSMGGAAGFGSHAHLLPDLDGDGYKEIVTAAAGRLDVPTPGGVEIRSGRDGSLVWSFSGSHSGAHLGLALDLFPDQTGDQVPEIAAFFVPPPVPFGPPGAGVRILSGSNGQLLATMIVPALHLDGDPKLKVVPDTTGDGIPELMLGSLTGTSTGNVPMLHVLDYVQGTVVETITLSGGTNPQFTSGIELLPDEDVNGDGVPEIVVGYPDLLVAGRTGRVDVFDGSTRQLILSNPGILGVRNLGASMAWLPDRNGDGLPELAVGAPAIIGLSAATQQPLDPAYVLILDGQSGYLTELIAAPQDVLGFGCSMTRRTPSGPFASVGLLVGGFVEPSSSSISGVPQVVAATLEDSPVNGWVVHERLAVLPNQASRGKTEVVVDDLNLDGLDDVLLSSPGKFEVPQANGELHLYLGTGGVPYGAGNPLVHRLAIQPTLIPGPNFFFLQIDVTGQGLPPALPLILLVSGARDQLPFAGGTLFVDLPSVILEIPSVLNGGVATPVLVSTATVPSGFELFLQAGAVLPSAPQGVILSDGYQLTL